MKPVIAQFLLLSPLLAFSQPPTHVATTTDPASVPQIKFGVATFKVDASGDFTMQPRFH